MKIFLSIFLIAVTMTSIAQASLDWAKSMGGTADNGGYSLTVDDAGNVYTIGVFESTADFDPGGGTFNLTSAGGFDMFISKLDASGNFVWARSIGGTSNERVSIISVDGAGNVYTTGGFEGTVDFDPGVGIFNLTSAGGRDIFVSKLDASGNFVWARSMGGASTDLGESIALDGAGNVYITGGFEGTVDFDPGGGIFNLISAGDPDIFVSKLDALGNFVWAISMGGTSYDYVTSIAVDGTGDVYTTGGFMGTADFDPGAAVNNITSVGITDVFVSKLDASGNFVWAKSIGGTSDDEGASIAVDEIGNIYYTGGFNSNSVDFDPGAAVFYLGGNDIFVSKLDASGNFVWAISMGGTLSNSASSSIAVDGAGNVYTTGYFQATADFDPGGGTFNFTSAGVLDIFVSKLDASGNFVWAISMGGPSFDSGASIALDGIGNIYTTGAYRGTVDFDPGATIYNLTSASTGGGADIFVQKLNQTSVGIEEQSNTPKKLLRIVDLMGRESTPQKNMVLIYVYSDGTTERIFEFE